MIASLIAASLASAAPAATLPPCCTASVPNAEIARCAAATLSDTGISERDARRIKVGSTAAVLGAQVTFKKGDTFWSLCAAGIVQKQVAARRAAEDARFAQRVAELDREYADLAKRYDELHARIERSRRHRRIAQAFTLVLSAGLYPAYAMY